ncbi:chorismate mutase [Pseudomonas sp.]|uniref:chorismate mutase n=1 Tax=Pseudomonas sp. TaxID=306 RepID=UPI003C731396
MVTPEATSQLSSLRQTIDNIDAALVHILAERFRCTDRVGALKARYRLQAVDQAREKQQYQRLTALAEQACIDKVFVEKLMTFIISEVVQRHRQIAADNDASPSQG